MNEAGHPIHPTITPVVGFSSDTICAWAMENLAPGLAVHLDGLACFRFNRRLSLAAMTERIANAVCFLILRAELNVRVEQA